MSIDQHVSVTVLVNNAGIALQGFGTCAILTYKTDLFAGKSATYTRLADVIAAGFDADSPEALAAAAILGQSPHPTSLKMIKGLLPPTLRYHVVVEDANEAETYDINVKGEGVTATAVSVTPAGGDDEADIAGDLITALNAVVGKNYLAVVDSSDPNAFYVTGTNPADWFSLELGSSTLMSSAIVNADPGIATDLSAILAVDKDWYYLVTCYQSESMVLAAMAWIEATDFKAYPTQVHDTDCENTGDGGGDIIDQWKDLGYKRSFPLYHRKPNQMLGAGFCGRVAPLSVGAWSGAYMTITGASHDEFEAQQLVNLDAKKGSYYKEEAGFSIIWETKVSNTQYGFFDVTVALDFVLDLIQKKAFAVKVALANAGGKVGYTDEDIQGMLLPAVEGAVDICKSDKHKIVAPGTPGSTTDPQPTVSFPRVKDIDPSSRVLRELPDGNVSFRMQGAVHKTFIDVNVSF